MATRNDLQKLLIYFPFQIAYLDFLIIYVFN